MRAHGVGRRNSTRASERRKGKSLAAIKQLGTSRRIVVGEGAGEPAVWPRIWGTTTEEGEQKWAKTRNGMEKWHWKKIPVRILSLESCRPTRLTTLNLLFCFRFCFMLCWHGRLLYNDSIPLHKPQTSFFQSCAFFVETYYRWWNSKIRTRYETCFLLPVFSCFVYFVFCYLFTSSSRPVYFLFFFTHICIISVPLPAHRLRRIRDAQWLAADGLHRCRQAAVGDTGDLPHRAGREVRRGEWR